MSKLCAVKWCVAQVPEHAPPGCDYCPVHALDPHYKPSVVEAWAPSWEKVTLQIECEACGGEGGQECFNCGQDMECEACNGWGWTKREVLRNVETGEELTEAQWEARRASEPGGWLFLPPGKA